MQALMGGGMGGMPGANGVDAPLPDTAETVYISSMCLLKMMKHGAFVHRTRLRTPLIVARRTGRSGVPFEVMGLMLGDFVDDYTIKVRRQPSCSCVCFV